MKKIICAAVAMVAVLIMIFSLAAYFESLNAAKKNTDETTNETITSVARNRYVCEDVVFSFSDDYPENHKSDFLEQKEQLVGKAEIAFFNDGTGKLGNVDDIDYKEAVYYIQVGDAVYVYHTKEDADAGDASKALMSGKVKGDKLILVQSDVEGTATMTMTFKKK